MHDPRQAYRDAERHHTEARDRAHRASLTISTLRFVTFLAIAAALLAWDALEGSPASAALLAAAALAVFFVALVARHRAIRAEERRQEIYRGLAVEGLLRLDRGWTELEKALPEVESRPWDAPEGHAYAADLDIFGEASLVRLAGPVTSASGRRTLRDWLLGPAPPAVARARQEAIRELTPARDFRGELAARGRMAPPSEGEALNAFLAWAADEPWLLERRWTTVLAWVLPLMTIALATLEILRHVPPFWAVSLALQLWLLSRVRRRIVEEFGVVEEGAPSLQAAGPQLRLLEETTWRGPLLRELTGRLATEGEPAHRSLARLTRLTDFVASRRNLVYATLVPILLIDVHLAFALDRWRARWGRDIGWWLDALGEMEALSSLATLGYDNPEWVMPELEASEEGVVRARALGHPLLPPDTCVCNDVEVGPPGTFLFITGSNMSGKSTLMRAVGSNVVLAAAGGPVCAGSMALPPVRLWTSMRVDDSVTDGISRFMAELLRVRSVVEAARDRRRGEPPVLYLLDEMLQGTNTAERRVAARAVLRHLLEEGAIGGVTSHDLTLADAPDLEPVRRAYHFRERVEAGEHGTELHFDYLLRPGVATTRNALRLLEAVGLGHVDEKVEEST
ncbi:MAG: MutS family DNA mismatch repair protein [Gemmatimonadetes bacterium]|nr:MutS family DNA mismatch repair protein [Gemmatimonadota bacterium]